MVSFIIGGALFTSPAIIIPIICITLLIAAAIGFYFFPFFFSKKPEVKPGSHLPHREKIKLADGRILEGPDKVLGKGAFGKVCQYQLDGQAVAVKVPFNKEMDDVQRKELEMLRKANPHAHIIQFIAEVEIKKSTWIIMELMQGSVRDLLDHYPTLSWQTKLSIAIQITKGVIHLHNLTDALFDRKAIIHQDLKTANIMVDRLADEPGIQVKIADFGLAREMSHLRLPLLGVISSQLDKGTPGGTLTYCAPELVAGEESSLKSDIFSLGIVFWELATGQKPYREKKEIINGTFSDFAKEKIPDTSQSFFRKKTKTSPLTTYPRTSFFGPIIENCISPEPSRRHSASKVLKALEHIPNNSL